MGRRRWVARRSQGRRPESLHRVAGQTFFLVLSSGRSGCWPMRRCDEARLKSSASETHEHPLRGSMSCEVACGGRIATRGQPLGEAIIRRVEFAAPCGAVAQLGERRVRNAKVGSSILLRSTNVPGKSRIFWCGSFRVRLHDIFGCGARGGMLSSRVIVLVMHSFHFISPHVHHSAWWLRMYRHASSRWVMKVVGRASRRLFEAARSLSS